MEQAFLPFDVCAKLVAAGMTVQPAEHEHWWSPDGCYENDTWPESGAPIGYTPAVTPLQALDWLVASGRIDAWELRQGECRAWDARPIATPDWCTWKQPTPTDLVRAILEAA